MLRQINIQLITDYMKYQGCAKWAMIVISAHCGVYPPFPLRVFGKIIPPPPYSHFFVSFVNVLLTLYYDYMCSETDFTQEKVNFYPTTRIPNSSSYCCCPPADRLQGAGPSF